MERYMSARRVRNKYIKVLGSELGPVYYALYNECVWLQFKWWQYVELYGTSAERIELLNRSATRLFQIIQGTLWDGILLHLTRLTGPPKSMGKDNLSIQLFPNLIRNLAFRTEIENLVAEAVQSTKFARDWRNRRIAHQDLMLAISQGAKPLASASRKKVKNAIHSVCRVVERIGEEYLKQELHLDLIHHASDAVSLLYVIRDGLEAEEKRRQRIRERRVEPTDLQPPQAI